MAKDYYIKKVSKLIFWGAILFFFLRLISINSIPIFNDEAIFIRWGEALVTNFDKYNVPVSLDGKQMGTPLLFAFSQNLPFDPIISARLPVVFFSLVTYIASVLLARKIYPNKNLFFLVLIVSFCPYLLIFDRLALSDSIVTALYSLSIYQTINLLEKPNTRNSILWGMIVSLGWWFKSTILLAVIPLLILFIYRFFRSPKDRLSLVKSSTVIIFTFILLILPIVGSPAYSRFTTFASSRFISFSDFINFPIVRWLSNLGTIFIYIIIYGGPLLFISFLVGFENIRKNKLLLLCLLFFVLPIIFETLFLQNINGRYPTFFIPVYIILSWGGMYAFSRYQKIIDLVLVASVIMEGVILILSPLSFYRLVRLIPVVYGDFGQYVGGWTSGFGVKEAADFLKIRSKQENIVVFVRYDSGNPEDGVGVYLYKEKIPFVPIEYFGAIDSQMGKDKMKVSYYFVSRGRQYAGLDDRLTELAKYNKPMDSEFVGVYQITPK